MDLSLRVDHIAFRQIATELKLGRTVRHSDQVASLSSNLQAVHMKKGRWSREEDAKLEQCMRDCPKDENRNTWDEIAQIAGLERCGKSCRLRWTNYLRPDIKRGKFSEEEEEQIIYLHSLFGNRWTDIADFLDRRTDHEIKNYWNTHLKKQKEKRIRLGIDPITLLSVPAAHNATDGPFVGKPWPFPDQTSMQNFLMEELSPSSSLPNTGGRDFKSDVRRLQANNAAQLAQAQADHAAQLAQAQKDHAAQLAQAQADHAAQLAQAQKDYAAQLAQAQKDHAAQLAQAQKDYAEQLAQVYHRTIRHLRHVQANAQNSPS